MTKLELEARLQEEGFRQDSYSLNGSTPGYDGLVLVEAHGRWSIQYMERGMASSLGNFSSESDACDRMYELLSKDPTSRRHNQ